MDHVQSQSAKERINEFAGAGCLLQAAGLAAPFVLGAALGVTGAAAGVVLLVMLWTAGTRRATRWRCVACKNPIDSPEVEVCPACGALLD